ncbi:MAG: AAA family ATPase [Gammaproteobacteria bacterium]|nr:AAA family ATPase [Gammaproteobacteria bacterium]MCP5424873.1 AAA family ATPase [Gammaproteobacteria bacterium]MCP5458150.1 AAA family ATPase [Gammaproteobacteria bacterium]
MRDYHSSVKTSANPGSDLIGTKLVPPLRNDKWIVRGAVPSWLEEILSHLLTLVVAPAGYGKTTLLAQWREHLLQEGVCTAWVSMDRDDNSLYAFVSYLLAALAGASLGVGRVAQEVIRNDHLTPLKSVISVLINEIADADRPIVLILDDMDLLESEPVNDLLFRLLRYAPPNLHVVIAGRAEPWLAVSYFRMHGQLARINVDDLRFQYEDAELFFRDVAGLSLKSEEVRQLWSATEGWVTGLQLVSIVFRGRAGNKVSAAGLGAISHELSSYITDNVLAALPARIVDFLLRVSVLERVSPALAVVTTGFDDAAKLLGWLERRGLFLAPLSEQREWYRFHSLLLDYLRKRLEREMPAAEVARLHRRASGWLAGQGFWQEAVRHALAAGDEDQAARWVENCAIDLIERGDLRTVTAWLGRLPEQAIRSRLRLRLAQAWSYSLGLHPKEAARTVQQIQADLEAGILQVQDDHALACEILAVRALTAGLTDDSPTSLRLGREALAMRPPHDTWVERLAHTALVFGLVYQRGFAEIRQIHRNLTPRDGSDETTYAWVYQQCMFGLAALIEGNLIEAESLFSHTLCRAESEAGPVSAAATLPAGYLSIIYYEWDDLDRVEQVLDKRDALALETAANGSATRFSIARIRMLTLQGKFGAALRFINRAGNVARDRNWLRLLAACQGEAVRLLLADNALVKATRVFETLKKQMPERMPSPCGSFIEAWRSFTIASGRLAIVRQNANQAVVLLRSLCEELAGLGMNYLIATPRILYAAALDHCGEREAALRELGSVLRYGQKYGLIRSFIDEGESVRQLIEVLYAKPQQCPEVANWYLEDLLKQFERCRSVNLSVQPAAGTAVESLQSLSKREVDILGCLAQGLSNKEIARKLKLSPETIKWHLKNVYMKLGVTSRLQAVRYARSRAASWRDGEG